jgi:hypothetical protein
MLWIAIFGAWMLVSVISAPLMGLALRRCDVLARARSVEALLARAEHPASHAA